MAVHEHTIELGGQPVRLLTAPPPAATSTVFLHGVPTSASDWAPVLERTGGLAPDLPGFGRSGKGGHLDLSLTGYVDWLERLLTSPDLPRATPPPNARTAPGGHRLRIVGHAWGAAIAQAYAERHPEQIERLVLIDAVPLGIGFRWPRLVRRLRTPVLGELLLGFAVGPVLRRVLRAGAATPDAWPPERLERTARDFDQGTQRAVLRLHRAAPEAALVEAGAELARISAPALIVWGAEDPWLLAELAPGLAGRLPNATAEIVQGAGHWPWLDRPEAAERIASFLA